MTGLVIDNFAGGGGASTGIEAALGRAVDIAINHDPEALAMHAANHSATRHYCQSIMSIDPLEATAGAPVLLVWFSPDCKHHSKAKGGQPRDKNIRDLATVVPHWLERLRKATPGGRGAPRIVCLENVEEFRQWGPLDAEGKPIRERRGEEFDLWVRRIRKQGYKVEWRELRACDYGAPTSRKRLFLVARNDGLPIIWPAPTHGKPGSPEVERGERLPWRTAAECIDWSRPVRSIFGRARPLKDTTLRRIAHGTMRYVVNAKAPFIVRVAHGDDGRHRTHPIDEPLGSATASPEYAVVAPSVFPITHSGAPRGSAIDAPLKTITTANRGEQALLGATLITMGYGERPGQNPRVPGLDVPARTIVSGGLKHGLVTAFLSSFYTSNTNGGRGVVDLPLKTILSGANHHAVVCAHVEQANGGPRNTNLAGRAANVPLSTIVGRGTTQRLIETSLIDADALPPDMLARAVEVAAFLVKYYGNEDGGHGLDEPLGAVTTRDRFAVVTVTIDSAAYVIVDIGMRMLEPRELANAQGFPPGYILAALDANGKPLTKTAQVRMIGNSVSPPAAEALVRAQVASLADDAARYAA